MEVNRDKGGVEIEAANKYRYLGLAFTTLNVKRGTDHLVAKGKKKKVVINLCTSFQKC